MGNLNNPQEIKRFLIFLRSSKEFWLLIFALVVGVTLGGWSSVRVIRISIVGLVVSLAHAFVAGFVIILYFCYRKYESEKLQPTHASVEERFISVKRELVCAIPLFLAGIADIYFILTNRVDFILVMSAVCIPLWIGLRFLIVKKNITDLTIIGVSIIAGHTQGEWVKILGSGL